MSPLPNKKSAGQNSPKRRARRKGEASKKRVRSHEDTTLGYYFEDLRTKAGLLTKHEERDLGALIQFHQEVAIRHMYVALEMAERILTEGEALFPKIDDEASEAQRAAEESLRADHLRAAERLRRTYNWGRLRGQELMAHVRHEMVSESGLDLLERFGAPEGDRAAQLLMTCNLRLVVSIARKWHDSPGVGLADRIQDGNIGLILGVIRFDHQRGLRFSTYATWWIRHAIQRGIADKGRGVRLPVHLFDDRNKFFKKQRELKVRLGREPDHEELAKALKMTPEKLWKFLSRFAPIASLDAPWGHDDESDLTAYDRFVVEEADAPPFWKTVDPGQDMELLHAALKVLKPIEMDVIRLRFGLDDDEERTFQEIGDKYRLSRERIRQLQGVALQKLRRVLAHELNPAA